MVKFDKLGKKSRSISNNGTDRKPKIFMKLVFVSQVSSPYFNLSFKDDVDVNEEFGKLLNGLEIFEKELSGDYFGGKN